MQAEAPKNDGLAVGVAAVQYTAVVQINHRGERFFGRFGPVHNFLAPVLAGVAVNLAEQQQLDLGSVPQ